VRDLSLSVDAEKPKDSSEPLRVLRRRRKSTGRGHHHQVASNQSLAAGVIDDVESKPSRLNKQKDVAEASRSHNRVLRSRKFSAAANTNSDAPMQTEEIRSCVNQPSCSSNVRSPVATTPSVASRDGDGRDLLLARVKPRRLRKKPRKKSVGSGKSDATRTRAKLRRNGSDRVLRSSMTSRRKTLRAWNRSTCVDVAVQEPKSRKHLQHQAKKNVSAGSDEILESSTSDVTVSVPATVSKSSNKQVPEPDPVAPPVEKSEQQTTDPFTVAVKKRWRQYLPHVAKESGSEGVGESSSEIYVSQRNFVGNRRRKGTVISIFPTSPRMNPWGGANNPAQSSPAAVDPSPQHSCERVRLSLKQQIVDSDKGSASPRSSTSDEESPPTRHFTQEVQRPFGRIRVSLKKQIMESKCDKPPDVTVVAKQSPCLKSVGEKIAIKPAKLRMKTENKVLTSSVVPSGSRDCTEVTSDSGGDHSATQTPSTTCNPSVLGDVPRSVANDTPPASTASTLESSCTSFTSLLPARTVSAPEIVFAQRKRKVPDLWERSPAKFSRYEVGFPVMKLSKPYYTNASPPGQAFTGTSTSYSLPSLSPLRLPVGQLATPFNRSPVTSGLNLEVQPSTIPLHIGRASLPLDLSGGLLLPGSQNAGCSGRFMGNSFCPSSKDPVRQFYHPIPTSGRVVRPRMSADWPERLDFLPSSHIHVRNYAREAPGLPSVAPPLLMQAPMSIPQVDLAASPWRGAILVTELDVVVAIVTRFLTRFSRFLTSSQVCSVSCNAKGFRSKASLLTRAHLTCGRPQPLYLDVARKYLSNYILRLFFLRIGDSVVELL